MRIRISPFLIQKVSKILDDNLFEQIKLKQESLYEARFGYRNHSPHLVLLYKKIQRDRISLYNQGYHKRVNNGNN